MKIDDCYLRWKNLYFIAQHHMEEVSNNRGLLIEVAAQHPLTSSGKPNEEFSARLDRAIELYFQQCNRGQVVKIYVPGSLHRFKGITDKISLSDAGSKYLIEHGVNENDIFGEAANIEFKGEDGVYNSSDECYVASKLFKKLAFGKIVSFCSPAQLMRKALSYIQFGIIPDMYSVPCEHLFHDYVDEVFLHIPVLVNDETGLQVNSEEAERLRKLRKPSE